MCNIGGHPRPDVVQNGFGRSLAESGHFGELSASLTTALYSQCHIQQASLLHNVLHVHINSLSYINNILGLLTISP